MGLAVSEREGPLGPWGGWRGVGAVGVAAGEEKFRDAAGPVGGTRSAAGPRGGDFTGVEAASVAGGFGVGSAGWATWGGWGGGAGRLGVSRAGGADVMGVGAFEICDRAGD